MDDEPMFYELFWADFVVGIVLLVVFTAMNW
jgi:hypothetical protein